MDINKIKETLKSADKHIKFIMEEYERISNKSDKTEGEINFIKGIQEIKRIEKSQEAYLKKYSGLKVKEYDVETFMPIYEGVPKWKDI